MIKYAGLSTTEKPILSKLYAEGWDAVVAAGFHDRTSLGQDNDMIHHFVAKDKRTPIGILSIWEDDTYTPSEARVMMLYVKPQYRGFSVGRDLHNFAIDWCRQNSFGSLSVTCHRENRHMLDLQWSLGGAMAYVTFQYPIVQP